MSSLSVAIIMKNEESCIARCLTCVSKLGDEIIVVDTGSTDKSKEIASSFQKVKVFDSEFFNKDTDFSDFEFGKAKNEAIKKCTKNFVIWWDADDFIDDENISKIREIVQNEKRDCLYSFDISYGPLRFEHCRLLKNGVNILFDEEHACHEYLNSLGFPLFIRKDIVIQHLPEHKNVPSHSRNMAIMEKDYFVRNRRDQRTCFYLANAYRESNLLEKSINLYDEYLKLSSWKEERFFARYYKAQCLYRMGKTDESRDEIFMAMAEDSRFAEAMCFMGDVMFSKEKYERAILWYKLAMDTPYPEDARLFVSRYSYSDYPSGRISECMGRMGCKEVPIEIKPQAEVTKPEEPMELIKRRYVLPEDRGLAMLAAMALSNCASSKSEGGTKPLIEIEVFPTNAFQKEIVESFNTLKIGEGAALGLSLPKNLKGKHAQEWFAKSAGFLGVEFFPISIVRQPNRGNSYVLLDSSIEDLEVVFRVIKMEGLDVELLDEVSFKEAVSLFKDAALFVGNSGWKQHLSEWMKVPAYIFFKDERPEEFGWEDQENRQSGDLKGFGSFIKRGDC